MTSTLYAASSEASLVEWSPTGDELIVVTVNSELQLWDPGTSEQTWSVEAVDDTVREFARRPVALTFSPDGSTIVLMSGDFQLRLFDPIDGAQPIAPVPVRTEGVAFAFDSLFWIDGEALVLGVPYGGGIESFDLRNGTKLPTVVQGVSVTDGVFSRSLDRYVGIGLAGLSLWSTDGSGPLERVVPLTAEQRAALVTNNGSIHTSLAADGSRLLVSAFGFPAVIPTMSYDLRTEPPTASVFDAAGPITIGWGEFTMEASFSGISILDAQLEPVGPGAPLPPDFNEVSASPDGRFYAIGRTGGWVDLHSAAGELLATMPIDVAGEIPEAIVIASFTSDGRLLAGTTTDGRFAVWATDTLERIDIRVEGIASGSLAGPWLWAFRTDDGSVVRIDPYSSTIVGAPLLPTPFGGYSRLDETNQRLAGVGSDSVTVIDVETGRQIGRTLPYIGIRIEWSADGSLLSVPSNDRVTLWNFDTDAWPDIACETAGRNLTRDEWTQFGPRTIEYRATCSQYPIET